MSRPSIIDSSEIGERAKQIAAEELAALTAGCDCSFTIDAATGAAIKKHERGCRYFVEPVPGCGLAPTQRAPEDDWAALKRATCPTAAFLASDLGPSMRVVGDPRAVLTREGVRVERGRR